LVIGYPDTSMEGDIMDFAYVTKAPATITALMAVLLVLAASSCASTPSGAGTAGNPATIGFGWPKGTAKTIQMLKPLMANCPKAPSKPAAFIADDISASSGTSTKITEMRLSVIKSVLTQAAVCSGSARVVAFTGSTATSVPLFDDTLVPEGQAVNAKLIHVPTLVDQAMAAIAAARVSAIKTLQQNGSAITAAYELASEYGETLPAGMDLRHIEILSDGEATGVPGLLKATPAKAAAIARDLPQPAALPETTSARISGLGQTAKKPAPTAVTAALKNFYTTYCKRTGAARCRADVTYQTRP
jgi:hypothetical protein